MTDYTKLVAAVRDTDFGDTCVYCEHSDMCKDADCIILQAADAIEALQADLERKHTADCFGCKCEKLEPKRGEWVGVSPMVDTVQCSVCGGQLFSAELETPYCPYCGAKMEVQDGQK